MEALAGVRTLTSAVRFAALAAVLALGSPAAAGAAVVAEGADAGNLPATARAVEVGEALEAITGSIAHTADQDLYAICLTGEQAFSATTTVGSALADSQLFLFDEQGLGIAYNDDASTATFRSTLPAGHSLLPSGPGRFLLGISAFNDDPRDAGGGAIFPNFSTGVHGPSSSAGALAAWSDEWSQAGAYRITLTGAGPCEAPDEQAPSIEITTPADGAEYVEGDEVLAAYSCADEDGGSGLASCAGDLAPGAMLDTSVVGAFSFTVRAADAAGNESSLTHAYRVVYPFSGPFGPLAAYPAANERKAGATAPYKFSLGGDRGMAVVTGVESAPVACGSGEEPASGAPADVSPTTYDAGVYQFNWKTDRAWSGTCRHLLVRLDDGTLHRALFSFS